MTGGTGRKKVEIKKREKSKERMVTFSKRRRGLFKKVSELHSKTAAKAAVAVYSPGGRIFIHGEPSFDSVVDFLEKAIGKESNTLLDHSHPHPGSALINHVTATDDHGEQEEEEEEASGSDTAAFMAKKWLESLEFDEYNDEEEVESFLSNLQELERKLEELQFYHLFFT